MLSPLTLVNGLACAHGSVLDRGFAYGDGLFETLAVDQRSPLRLDRHLARLREGARRLRIPLDDQLEAVISDELRSLCEAFEAPQAVAKIILTRGEGGRGYRPPTGVQPGRIVRLSERPVFPRSHEETGIELFLCETRLGINPALAGIKHLNRLEQVLARSEWEDEYPEGLVRDIEGRIVEGTMSNLFLLKNGELLTPRLHRCGVAGTVRALIIESAQKHGIAVRETDLWLKDLEEADAMAVTNSLIGYWPVNAFQGRRYTIAPWQRLLAPWLKEGVKQC
ncbi:aminodeoxychorismate lyase [Motiliproteus sp. SC1-56]|uniref:aminodeoxychorismate lyase n=1 Tax=Motiliproteus sp. SC1-56 TaxID=2799565 RepID=UPI001A8F094F|nr:aminodeoxychorismate lyase [Motiliproteus sp. SC1-56]